MQQQFFAKRKPKRCPKFGTFAVASILYGMPDMSEELHGKMESGLIILGGCVVSGNDPAWQCNSCGIQIFRDER